MINKKDQTYNVLYPLPYDDIITEKLDVETKLQTDFPRHEPEPFRRHLGGDVFRVINNSDH